MYTRLIWNSICSQRWQWISGSPTSFFPVLRLKGYTTYIYYAGDWTQSHIHSRRALCQLSYILSPTLTYIFGKLKRNGIHEVGHVWKMKLLVTPAVIVYIHSQRYVFIIFCLLCIKMTEIWSSSARSQCPEIGDSNLLSKQNQCICDISRVNQ